MFNKVHYTIRKQFQISKKKIRQAFTPLKISFRRLSMVSNLHLYIQSSSHRNHYHTNILLKKNNNKDYQDNKHSPEDPKNGILLMFAMAFSIYICNKHTI